MARKVLVRLVDDLDGLPSEDVATVTFGLDGVSYQIDLNESNASKLRDELAPFVGVARRTGGRIKRGAGVSARSAASSDAPAIREWARKQGHELAERGRIPGHIVEEYRAAGSGRTSATAKATRAAKPAAAKKPAGRTAAKGRATKTAAAVKTASARATAKAAKAPARRRKVS